MFKSKAVQIFLCFVFVSIGVAQFASAQAIDRGQELQKLNLELPPYYCGDNSIVVFRTLTRAEQHRAKFVVFAPLSRSEMLFPDIGRTKEEGGSWFFHIVLELDGRILDVEDNFSNLQTKDYLLRMFPIVGESQLGVWYYRPFEYLRRHRKDGRLSFHKMALSRPDKSYNGREILAGGQFKPDLSYPMFQSLTPYLDQIVNIRYWITTSANSSETQRICVKARIISINGRGIEISQENNQETIAIPFEAIDGIGPTDSEPKPWRIPSNISFDNRNLVPSVDQPCLN